MGAEGDLQQLLTALEERLGVGSGQSQRRPRMMKSLAEAL